MAKKEQENKDAAFNIPIFTPENKDKVEEFYEKNKMPLTIGVTVVLLVLIGFFAYKNLVVKPKNAEAQSLMYMAEQYFAKDSFDLALNGKIGNTPDDESFYGFLDIIDEFGMTKSGKLAKYYAGICYLRTGDYESAIAYLKKYNTESINLQPLSLGALGDAYSELEEYDKAVSYYLKGARSQDNKFTAPLLLMKAGLTLEKQDKLNKALEVYKELKEKYADSQEGGNVDKYIGRVEAKLGK